MTGMGTTTTVLRPTDLAEAVAALADTTGPVLISGSGTAADWAGAPEPADLTLDTTGLTGVIAHNPGDMTVAVRAGTPLRELNAELAGQGQRVALDAARIDRGATVGGLIATADAGPSALAHGSLRDLVIGMTVVLADGTAARSGGHVIKNVAGYDLAKLLHGSHGAVALIAEVVLRLHPVPAATATVRLAGPLDRAVEAARTVLAGPWEPAALEWTGDALLIRLTGTEAATATRADRLAASIEGAERVDGPASWTRHAELVDGPLQPDTSVLRIGVRPSRLPGVLRELSPKAVTAGLATGVATLRLPVGAVADAHRVVHGAGGTSMLRSRPPGCPAPAWGPAPSAVGVLRAVRSALDPDGRLGAGRFTPWM
jgi:glycolate oxidase FAD binding subunit